MDDRELEANAIVLLRPAVRGESSPISADEERKSVVEDDITGAARIWMDPTSSVAEARRYAPARQKSVLHIIHQTSTRDNAPPVAGRRKALTVLSIERGSVERENLTASQILQIVRDNAPGHFNGSSGGLKLRDIRQISNTAIGSQRPSIEPRRGCVVINMPFAVRALILVDKVLLITSGGGDGCQDSPGLMMRREASSHVLDRLQLIAKPLVGNNLTEPLLEAEAPRVRATAPKLLGPTANPVSSYVPVSSSASCFNVDDEFEDEATSSDDSMQCSALVRKLVRLSAMVDAGPLEFMALECILFEVIRKLADETSPACEIATHTRTNALSYVCTTSKLHQIRELKKLLQEAATKAEGISQSLTEVLGSEEDIRRLELSRFRDSPQDWDEPSDSHGAEDVEILLESYQQDIQGLVQQIEDADESLDLTIQMMQLQLATTRTLLLKVEIALQVMGVAMGFVSALAGIFGMNLKNGLENRQDVFWFLTIAMVGLIVIAILASGLAVGRLNL